MKKHLLKQKLFPSHLIKLDVTPLFIFLFSLFVLLLTFSFYENIRQTQSIAQLLEQSLQLKEDISALTSENEELRSSITKLLESFKKN